MADEVWFTQSMLKELLTGAVGALLGAWGGAYAIQRIADRAKRREAYWNEVVRTNKAIEIGHGILNTFLNVKEQYVRDMSARYEQHWRAAIRVRDQRQSG